MKKIVLNSLFIASLTLMVIVFTSCKNKRSADLKLLESTITDNGESLEVSGFKTFELDFGFKVTVGEEMDLDDYKTYQYFKLERNNSVVYLDNSGTEYIFAENLYPLLLQAGPVADNSFELLFEIDGRPGINQLKRLLVANNKLTGNDILPTFVNTIPTDILGDGNRVYAGFLDFFQFGNDNEGNSTAFYNPILYYSVTDAGLKLDSLLTKQRNEIIYGQFHGFSPDYSIERSMSVVDKFTKEIKIIINE